MRFRSDYSIAESIDLPLTGYMPSAFVIFINVAKRRIPVNRKNESEVTTGRLECFTLVTLITICCLEDGFEVY